MPKKVDEIVKELNLLYEQFVRIGEACKGLTAPIPNIQYLNGVLVGLSLAIKTIEISEPNYGKNLTE